MARLKKLSNRLVVFVIFILSFARVMVARILPWAQPPDNPSATKVFALSDAQWLQLRAIDDQNSSQQPAEKKDPPAGNDTKGEPPKAEENQSQKPDCKPQTDAKNTPEPGDKKDDSGSTQPTCDEASPGGGDGDMGGTGG